MAVKTSYRIPVGMDRSFLDHEISLSTNGISVRPLPIKVLLFYVVSVMLLAWICVNTFVRDSGGWIAAFIVWWLAATMFMGKYSKTKEMRFSQVLPLLSYIPKASRVVMTRLSSRPDGFYSIVGIKGIDPEGLIQFTDGGLGRLYRVVGSASVLLFEADRDRMLNRADAFWRKIDTDTQYVILTTRESQPIYRQAANLERMNHRLSERDPELLELMDERFDILNGFVGGRFTSIHQYLMLRATNPESLRRAENLLRAEVEGSSLLVKKATRLDADDAADVLKVLYQGRR